MVSSPPPTTNGAISPRSEAPLSPEGPVRPASESAVRPPIARTVAAKGNMSAPPNTINPNVGREHPPIPLRSSASSASAINVRNPATTTPSTTQSNNTQRPSRPQTGPTATGIRSIPAALAVNGEEENKGGKPAPPKRLPVRPPGEEDAADGASPASPTSASAPSTTPLRVSSGGKSNKPDQTKKQLPPTPHREDGNGEGANEESSADIEAMDEKRMNIIKEIVATEQTYVNNLNIALRKYKEPLLDSCNTKDKDATKRKEDVQGMFSNMEIIYSLNAELLRSIQEVTECDPSSPNYLMVGEVFGKFTPFLKMYQQYSVGYEHAMEIFNKWQKDTVCLNLLKSCNESSGQNLKLDHYLIFPIQRIPRYNLLLQDLLKNTPEGHPDKPKLINSLETNKKVAEHINSNLKLADNVKKIVSAVAIDGLDQLMAPARNLVSHEKVDASRIDLTKYDLSRVTDIAKARTAQREKLQLFLFNNLFAVREDKTGSLFSGSSNASRANWQLPQQLWLKEDPGSETGLLFLGPQEGFYVNFPQIETRNAWIDAVAELTQTVDVYREFEYQNDDGSLYNGRWFAGKYDGTGTLSFYGNVYTGEWLNSQKHGMGKLTYATGDVYEGQWENDMQNGEGTITYAIGHVYTGEWRDGKRTGKGEMVYAEGKKYDGKWKDDMAYGTGVYTGGGITYDGNWQNGKMSGKGTLETPQYIYTGLFTKGKKDGNGSCEWKDGSKYEGNWRDDRRSGTGKYTCEAYTYDGEWVNDRMDGKGKAEYPWGVYKGEWAQGVKSGKGTLTYPNGTLYEGTFKNEMFNGAGVLIYPNGYKWEGKFQNGAPEGKGNITVNTLSNPASKKGSFVGVLKDRELVLSVGKDEVRCQCSPEIPVFELDW